MQRGLVGSEMCIRDRYNNKRCKMKRIEWDAHPVPGQWYYWNGVKKSSFLPYAEEQNQILEKAFFNHEASVDFSVKSSKYRVKLDSMLQINLKTKMSRELKRLPKEKANLEEKEERKAIPERKKNEIIVNWYYLENEGEEKWSKYDDNVCKALTNYEASKKMRPSIFIKGVRYSFYLDKLTVMNMKSKVVSKIRKEDPSLLVKKEDLIPELQPEVQSMIVQAPKLEEEKHILPEKNPPLEEEKAQEEHIWVYNTNYSKRGKYVPYDEDINKEIEMNFLNKEPFVKIKIKGKDYMIDFKRMVQINVKSKMSRFIMRKRKNEDASPKRPASSVVFPHSQKIHSEAKIAESPKDSPNSSLSEKQDPIPSSGGESLLCKICFEYPQSVIFIPCGHFGACKQCASGLKGFCPFCNTKYTSIHQVYQL
eukprot:TRINITY_DN10144_c0_g1_i5.p1 TRINITY_DN10144_c0_g1~~TRINITY_DN10144_c0_g1_i5.p1  ORF type:complete len:422 (+),score=82.02 TRINITY_DN10144_c0_g1_i5:122-1387(+)